MPLFQNEANAIGAWLTSEGFQFDDILSRLEEVGNRRHISWRVAFKPIDGQTCDEQRERYESFLDDAGFVERHRERPRIRPEHLRIYLGIDRPSGECAHTDCNDSATTLFVDPDRIVHGKQYCQHHADRLNDTILTPKEGMTHTDGKAWADW